MDRIAIAILVIAGVAGLVAFYRAQRSRTLDQIEPADFGLDGGGRAVAGFTSPMCLSCQAWRLELEAEGVPVTFVDVKERPELARRYHVRTTPAVLLVDLPSGRVLRQFRDDPRPATVAELRDAVLTAG